jgi:hypothetical protein
MKSKFIAYCLFIFISLALLKCDASELPPGWNDLKVIDREDHTYIEGFPYKPGTQECKDLIKFMIEMEMIESEADIFFINDTTCSVIFRKDFFGIEDCKCLKPHYQSSSFNTNIQEAPQICFASFSYEISQSFSVKKTEQCWIDTRCHGGVCCKPDAPSVDDTATQRCKENCSFGADSLAASIGSADYIPTLVKY